MKYKAFFKAKAEQDRNFDIKYCVCEENGSYYIESFVEGGSFSEKVFIGKCKEKAAEEIAVFFAKKGVHPVHTEDIITDMRL